VKGGPGARDLENDVHLRYFQINLCRVMQGWSYIA
jgi:hypothetical protein